MKHHLIILAAALAVLPFGVSAVTVDDAGNLLANAPYTGGDTYILPHVTRDAAGNIFIAGPYTGGETYILAPSATPPAITLSPVSACVPAGYVYTFTAGASGTAPLAYQWRLGTSPVAGATATSLAVTAGSGTIGSYELVVTNVAGSVTSSPAVLTTGLAPSFAATASLSGQQFQYTAGNSPFTIPGRILTINGSNLNSDIFVPMTNWLTWSNIPAGPLSTIQFTATNDSVLRFFRLSWP